MAPTAGFSWMPWHIDIYVVYQYCKTMASTGVRFKAKVRRVGNATAVFIPSAAARKAGIRPESTVDVEVTTHSESPVGLVGRLGLPAGLLKRDWARDKKRMWPDD
jgi:hypothetical protein